MSANRKLAINGLGVREADFWPARLSEFQLPDCPSLGSKSDSRRLQAQKEILIMFNAHTVTVAHGVYSLLSRDVYFCRF